jgi:hypothetical protein
VFDHPRTEQVEVQVRVANRERVEGPENRRHPALAKELALVFLQHPTYAATARFRMHSQHVGPVNRPAVPDPGQTEDKP